ncbi:hypothetical protein [Brevundimonas sp. Marseille-Q4549]
MINPKLVAASTLVLGVLALSGCAASNTNQFAAAKPVEDPRWGLETAPLNPRVGTDQGFSGPR